MRRTATRTTAWAGAGSMRTVLRGFRKILLDGEIMHKTPQCRSTTGSDRASGGNPVRGVVRACAYFIPPVTAGVAAGVMLLLRRTGDGLCEGATGVATLSPGMIVSDLGTMPGKGAPFQSARPHSAG